MPVVTERPEGRHAIVSPAYSESHQSSLRMKTIIPQSDTATLNALHPPTLTLILTLHDLTPNRPLPSLAQLSIGIRARTRARGERITRQPARDVGNGDKSHYPHDLPRTLASDELDGSVGRLVLDELVFASPCGVSSFPSVRTIVASGMDFATRG